MSQATEAGFGDSRGTRQNSGEKRKRGGVLKKCLSWKTSDEKSEKEAYLWTERERRKKMRNMFSGLHELLPHLSPKADKFTIVSEAINHIKSLQQKLYDLQKQKLDRSLGMAAKRPFILDWCNSWAAPTNSPIRVSVPRLPLAFRTWSSPNVVVSVAGDEAHINVCTARKPGIMSAICSALEKRRLEVMSAHVSSDRFRSMCMIHARTIGFSDQFPEALMIEDIYKSAAAEIMLCLV